MLLWTLTVVHKQRFPYFNLHLLFFQFRQNGGEKIDVWVCTFTEPVIGSISNMFIFLEDCSQCEENKISQTRKSDCSFIWQVLARIHFHVWSYILGYGMHWINSQDHKTRWPSWVTSIHFMKQINICTSMLLNSSRKEFPELSLVSNCPRTFIKPIYA